MLEMLFGYLASHPIVLAFIGLAIAYLWNVREKGPSTGGPARTIQDLYALLGDPDMQKLEELLRARLGDPETREKAVQLVEAVKTETAPAATKGARKR